jgi:hypothetical protein
MIPVLSNAPSTDGKPVTIATAHALPGPDVREWLASPCSAGAVSSNHSALAKRAADNLRSRFDKSPVAKGNAQTTHVGS